MLDKRFFFKLGVFDCLDSFDCIDELEVEVEGCVIIFGDTDLWIWPRKKNSLKY